MNARYFCFLIIALSFYSCNNKLLNPLKGSSYFSKEVQASANYMSTDAGSSLYLKPNEVLEVRAIEDCVIKLVFVTKDSNFIIVARGKANAAYGNLFKSFVVKGDFIKQGQAIGELYPKDSVENNFLGVSIEKDGRYLRPKW